MLFFKRFKKKKKCSIQDDYLLLIEWEKEFSPKKAEIHSMIEQVDREGTAPELEECLPYLTFNQAEALFSKIKATFIDTQRIEEFPIRKLSVVCQEDQKLLTEGEVFVSNFVIRWDYENVLKVLVEAILYQQDFVESDLTYDDKRAYFMDVIYPHYLKSLGVSDYNLLPIFPSEQEVLAGTAVVTVPAFSTPVPDDSDKAIGLTTSERSQNQAETETAVATQPTVVEAANQMSEQRVPEHQTTDFLGDSLMDELLSTGSEQQTEGYDRRTSSPRLSVNSFTVEATEESFSPAVAFPLFELEAVEGTHYEPYEQDYVSWKINGLKQQINQKIIETEKVSGQQATAALNAQLKQFERAEMRQIKQELAAADHRAELKPRIITVMQQRKATDLAEQKAELLTEKEQLLEEERIRHEQAVKAIEQEYLQTTKSVKADLDAYYLKAASNDYQEKYYAETAKLEQLLEEKVERLSIKKQEKEKATCQHMQVIGRKVGQDLYKCYERFLKKREAQLLVTYEYAKQVQLIEQQEEAARQQDHQLTEYVTQLQNKVTQLLEEKQRAEKDSQKMQEEVLQTKSSVIDQKLAFLKDYEHRTIEAGTTALNSTMPGDPVSITQLEEQETVPTATKKGVASVHIS